MPGCHECKHYDSKWDHSDSPAKLISRTCALGHTDIMNKWWEENGNKAGTENREDLDCHEHTDGVKMLNNMSSLLDKMNDLLD